MIALALWAIVAVLFLNLISCSTRLVEDRMFRCAEELRYIRIQLEAISGKKHVKYYMTSIKQASKC